MQDASLLLRPRDVAALLNVGRTTVYALLASGDLPAVRIGRSVRVPRDGLEAWVHAQTEGDREERFGS